MVFGTSDIPEAVQSPFSPEKATTDGSSAAIIQGINSVVDTGIQIFEKRQEEASQQKENSILNRFTQENLKLAEAVEQGAISSREARTRMRRSFSQSLSNNPTLFEALQERQNTIIKTAGLGEVIAEEDPQDAAMDKLIGQAIEEGNVRSDAPQGQLQQAAILQGNLNKARQNIKDLQQEASLEATQVGLSTSKLSLRIAQRREQSKVALFNLSSAQTPVFNNKLDSVVASFENGEVSREDAIRLVENEWAKIKTTINQVGSRAGNDHISNLAKPMEMIFNNTVKHLKGDLSKELLQNEIDKQILLSQQAWLTDPEIANLVAASRLIPNSNLIQLSQDINPAVAKKLASARTEEEGDAPNFFEPTDRGKKDSKSTLNLIKSNLSKDIKGQLDEETQAELSTSVSSIINSVEAFGSSVKDPSQARGMVSFLASPEFGNWTTEKGGIPSDSAVAAKETIQQVYEQRVLPSLREEFESGSAGTVPAQPGVRAGQVRVNKPAASLVEPVFSGSGIIFRKKQDVGDSVAGLENKINSLNKRVAPIVNELVRMSAHLEGHKRYKAVFDENYAQIFGEEPSEQEGDQ